MTEIESKGLPAKPKASSNSGNVIMTVAANIAIGVLSLGTGSLTARILGVHGRGELAAIQSVSMFVASIAQLGLPEAIVYFTARKPSDGAKYYTSALMLIAVSLCFFGALGYFLLPHLLLQQSPQVVRTAQIYLLWLLPFWTLLGLSQNALRGSGQLRLWNISRILPLVGWLLLLLIARQKGWRDSTAIANVFLIQMGISSAILVALVLKKLPGQFRPAPSELRGMVRYGLPAMATTAPQLLNLRLDQMLMAGLLPETALGLYAVAVAWSGMVSPILQGLGSVLFPRVAALTDANEKVAAFTQGSRVGVLVAICLSISLMAVTPYLLPLVFGADFRLAISPTLVLIVAAVISGINLIVEEGIRGLGHPAAVMRSELAGLALTVVCLFLFLKPLGIMGAALASLIGYSTTLSTLLLQASGLVSCSIKNLICPTRADVFLVSTRLRALRKAKAS